MGDTSLLLSLKAAKELLLFRVEEENVLGYEVVKR